MTAATNVFDAARWGKNFRPRRLPAPCAELPGSPGKVAALRARLEAGEELWSERDERDEDGED